ncbi:MAG: GFA family protein [Hoeflea sp.]|uniref:GFA family protein n=1 Tax=Hoeflea sp. TaxID=1940281 RepID=UPI00273225F1|nr:GFA family protein [Hoeflea sp.]MDP2122241.1 GFA family protein [Hoeflea sp.]MDP3526932.1 GFA family protein [Hoeflea sp.]
MSDTQIRTGRCNCGAVRFRTRGPLREVVACHCSQCRRQTGLYYAATNVADDCMEIEGEGSITWYQASEVARRGFCASCGSALFWKHRDDAHISVLAGSFDQPSGLRLASHIFCADKGDFYEIADGLPQYDRGSPGLLVAK